MKHPLDLISYKVYQDLQLIEYLGSPAIIDVLNFFKDKDYYTEIHLDRTSSPKYTFSIYLYKEGIWNTLYTDTNLYSIEYYCKLELIKTLIEYVKSEHTK